MKKIFLFFFLTTLLIGSGECIYAQVANQGPITYSFGGVYKNAVGEKIKKQDLQYYFDSYQYSDYINASRKYKTGIVLTGVGVGCFTISGLIIGGWANAVDRYDKKYEGDNLYDYSDEEFDDDTANLIGGTFYGGLVSWLFIGGGVVCTALGVPKIFIGNSKLKKVANNYNAKQNYACTIGPQKYGYGIAITF